MLASGEVRIWVWRCPPMIREARDLLSDGERARAARFVFERDRIRFVSAHAGLRRVLGALLGIEPSALRFVEDAGGKPRLAGSAAVFFNLSHSHDLAAVAVSVGAAPLPAVDANKVLHCEEEGPPVPTQEARTLARVLMVPCGTVPFPAGVAASAWPLVLS